jgi:hypothetical protein
MNGAALGLPMLCRVVPHSWACQSTASGGLTVDWRVVLRLILKTPPQHQDAHTQENQDANLERQTQNAYPCRYGTQFDQAGTQTRQQ